MSGTTIGRVIRCLTGVVCRSATGSATACLTCTVPTTRLVVVEHREAGVAGLPGQAR